MMPILFESNASDFSSNGIGVLTDAIECTVEEERNGIFQLHMVYPAGGEFARHIMVGQIISCPVKPQGTNALFDIVRVSSPKYDRIEIDAKHISYRLNKIVITPYRPSDAQSIGVTLSNLQNRMVNGDGFYFGSSGTFDTGIISFDTPRTARSVLGDVIETFGGEIVWHNNVASDKQILILKERGSARDFTLNYGTNITDFRQERNIEETITGIVPFWKGKNATGSVVVVLLTETVIYAPNASSFPRDYVVPVDFSSDFDTAPTEEQLRYLAKKYVRTEGVGVPKISLDVSFIQLSETEEYKHFQYFEQLGLCDTININYAKLGVIATAKIIRTVFDVLKGRYKEISLGDAKVRWLPAQTTVAPVKQEVTQLSKAVTSLQTITNGSGILGTNTNVQNSTLRRCTFLKWGNLVFVNLMLWTTAANGLLAKDVTLYTAPDGFKPPSNVMLSGTCTTGGSANATLFSIYTNGQIHQRNFDNCTAVQLSAIYAV